MNYSYTYPVSNGSIEVVVSEEQAINMAKQTAHGLGKDVDSISDSDHLEGFISVHWAVESSKAPGTYIESYTGSPVPVGATHLGPYGYIKEKGKFYYIYKDSGWLALSGKPVGAIYKL